MTRSSCVISDEIRSTQKRLTAAKKARNAELIHYHQVHLRELQKEFEKSHAEEEQ